MDFYTHWIRPEKKNFYEKNSGKPSMVNRASYIPLKRRIEDLILAGQRLQEYRQAQFDFENEEQIDENYFDPTRVPNYDIVDAASDLSAAQERIASRARERAEKERKDAADLQTLSDAPPEKEGSV